MEQGGELRVLGSDNEVELAHWQSRALEAERLTAQLEAAVTQQTQQLHEALAQVATLGEELHRAASRIESAEAEILQLHEWVQYSEQLTPAYEAALQQIEKLTRELEQVRRLHQADQEQLQLLGLELEEARKETAAPTLPPVVATAGGEQSGLDPVTGLPSFQLGLTELARLLQQAEAGGGLVALARIDIHRLRDLNLFLGSSTGDRILHYFAMRFGALLEDGQQLLRGRDDEFWLLLACTSGGPLGMRKLADQINQLFQRLGVALKRPFDVDDHSVHLNLSCGVACSQPGQTDASELLECAGLALERSKRETQSRIVYYQPEMLQPVRARLQQVPLLRQAVERAELELHFQPMVQLDTLQI